MNYPKQSITIFPDSQPAILAVSSNAIKSKQVWECLGEVNNLGSKDTVAFCWLPRHTEIDDIEKIT